MPLNPRTSEDTGGRLQTQPAEDAAQGFTPARGSCRLTFSMLSPVRVFHPKKRGRNCNLTQKDKSERGRIFYNGLK